MGVFVTSKSEIIAILDARTHIKRPYKQIADNLNVRFASGKESLVYSLKGTGLGDLKSHIGSKISGYHEFELEIKYPNNNVPIRDKNYEEWIAVIKAVVALQSFNNFSNKPTFVDFDQDHSIGTFKFLYGDESLC